VAYSNEGAEPGIGEGVLREGKSAPGIDGRIILKCKKIKLSP
jgi:hypothetical protein